MKVEQPSYLDGTSLSCARSSGSAEVQSLCNLLRGGHQGGSGSHRGGGSEIFIDSGRRFAALGNGPHHERLAAPHVARGENAGNGRQVIGVGGNVAARIKIYAELFDHSVAHGPEKAH